jgi:hypothetical protein
MANSTQRPLTCGLGGISIVESADLIGRHEHQRQFFVVFEVDTPDREALSVEAIWTQSISEMRGEHDAGQTFDRLIPGLHRAYAGPCWSTLVSSRRG